MTTAELTGQGAHESGPRGTTPEGRLSRTRRIQTELTMILPCRRCAGKRRAHLPQEVAAIFDRVRREYYATRVQYRPAELLNLLTQAEQHVIARHGITRWQLQAALSQTPEMIDLAKRERRQTLGEDMVHVIGADKQGFKDFIFSREGGPCG
jgi:hypothetical protein